MKCDHVKLLLLVTAMLEVGAGLALMAFPSTSMVLLLGSPLETSSAVTLGRLAGAALFSLGVANWFAQFDERSNAAKGVVSGMLCYNVGAVVILGSAGIWSAPVGIGLWPGVVLHTAMTVWCVALLRSRALGSTK